MYDFRLHIPPLEYCSYRLDFVLNVAHDRYTPARVKAAEAAAIATPILAPVLRLLANTEGVGLDDGEEVELDEKLVVIDDEGRTVVAIGLDVVVAAVIEKRLVARKAMLADATCWTCAHTVKLLYNQ